MKSLKFAAAFLAVAVACPALADTQSFAPVDSYLYFMASDSVKYNKTYVSAGGDVTYDYAKVSVDGGSTYLNLYSASTGEPTGSQALGKGSTGVAGFASSPAFSSFLIELYSFDSANRVGWTTLSYSEAMANYVYNDPTKKSEVPAYTVSQVIPEPTSGLLLLLGLSGLALRRRRASALA